MSCETGDLLQADYIKLLTLTGAEFDKSNCLVKFQKHKIHTIINKYIELRDSLKEKMYFKQEPTRIDRHKIAAIFVFVIVELDDSIFRIDDNDKILKNGSMYERHPDAFFGLLVGFAIIENFYNTRYEKDINNDTKASLEITITIDYLEELIKLISNTRDLIKSTSKKTTNIQFVFYFSHIFYLIENASLNSIELSVGE